MIGMCLKVLGYLRNRSTRFPFNFRIDTTHLKLYYAGSFIKISYNVLSAWSISEVIP